MPTFWQWFFAIVGGVAFIMATTSFLQIVFGQPKLEFTFGYDDSGGDGRLIKIYLRNCPIENRILQAFRVSRLAALDVFLTLQVFNTSTGKAILNLFSPDIALSSSHKANRVSLPPSSLSVSVSLAKWQRSTNSAVLFGNHDIPLQEGTYVVVIGRGLDGKVGRSRPFSFHVGNIETELMWDKDVTKTRWI